MLSPDHGSRVPVGWGGPLSSKVTTPLPGADRLRIVIAEPKIYGAFADEPMTDPSVMSHVPADRFSILSGGLPTGQTMNADVFRALPHGLFLWWAEYRAGEVVLARSPWALVRVAP